MKMGALGLLAITMPVAQGELGRNFPFSVAQRSEVSSLLPTSFGVARM